MILKKIIYFIIVLVLSAAYPTYQYMHNQMTGIDVFTYTVITFVIIHILYRINFPE